MMASSVNNLDLRGIPCPLNYVRSRLALEELPPGESCYIFLDQGEPRQMVISGLLGEGYIVEVIQEDSEWLKLKVDISDR